MIEWVRKAVLAVVLWAGLAGAAAAQEGAILNGSEARAALFGRELSGVTAETNIPWRECVENDGSTIYEFGQDAPRIGRLEVSDEGVACFAYSETQYLDWACWHVRRRGDNGIEFTPADGLGEDFIVTARPRVRGCSSDAPIA